METVGPKIQRVTVVVSGAPAGNAVSCPTTFAISGAGGSITVTTESPEAPAVQLRTGRNAVPTLLACCPGRLAAAYGHDIVLCVARPQDPPAAAWPLHGTIACASVVVALDWTAAGDGLLCATADGAVGLYGLETVPGKAWVPRWSRAAPETQSCVAAGATAGSAVATCAAGATPVRIWRGGTQPRGDSSPAQVLGHPVPVAGLQWRPTSPVSPGDASLPPGDTLMTWTADGAVRLWCDWATRGRGAEVCLMAHAAGGGTDPGNGGAAGFVLAAVLPPPGPPSSALAARWAACDVITLVDARGAAAVWAIDRLDDGGWLPQSPAARAMVIASPGALGGLGLSEGTAPAVARAVLATVQARVSDTGGGPRLILWAVGQGGGVGRCEVPLPPPGPAAVVLPPRRDGKSDGGPRCVAGHAVAITTLVVSGGRPTLAASLDDAGTAFIWVGQGGGWGLSPWGKLPGSPAAFAWARGGAVGPSTLVTTTRGSDDDGGRPRLQAFAVEPGAPQRTMAAFAAETLPLAGGPVLGLVTTWVDATGRASAVAVIRASSLSVWGISMAADGGRGAFDALQPDCLTAQGERGCPPLQVTSFGGAGGTPAAGCPILAVGTACGRVLLFDASTTGHLSHITTVVIDSPTEGGPIGSVALALGGAAFAAAAGGGRWQLSAWECESTSGRFYRRCGSADLGGPPTPQAPALSLWRGSHCLTLAVACRGVVTLFHHGVGGWRPVAALESGATSTAAVVRWPNPGGGWLLAAGPEVWHWAANDASSVEPESDDDEPATEPGTESVSGSGDEEPSVPSGRGDHAPAVLADAVRRGRLRAARAAARRMGAALSLAGDSGKSPGLEARVPVAVLALEDAASAAAGGGATAAARDRAGVTLADAWGASSSRGHDGDDDDQGSDGGDGTLGPFADDADVSSLKPPEVAFTAAEAFRLVTLLGYDADDLTPRSTASALYEPSSSEAANAALAALAARANRARVARAAFGGRAATSAARATAAAAASVLADVDSGIVALDTPGRRCLARVRAAALRRAHCLLMATARAGADAAAVGAPTAGGKLAAAAARATDVPLCGPRASLWALHSSAPDALLAACLPAAAALQQLATRAVASAAALGGVTVDSGGDRTHASSFAPQASLFPLAGFAAGAGGPAVTPESVTWPLLRATAAADWLPVASLRRLIEAAARGAYLARRDPADCALLYAVLGKRAVLAGLYRTARQTPLADFLGRDFAGDPSAREAALKNAYVLLGQHRPRLAAAFFVLGGASDDAVGLIAGPHVGDPQLAAAVALLADGDHGTGGLGPRARGLVDGTFLLSPNPWAQSLWLWRLGRWCESLDALCGGEGIEAADAAAVVAARVELRQMSGVTGNPAAAAAAAEAAARGAISAEGAGLPATALEFLLRAATAGGTTHPPTSAGALPAASTCAVTAAHTARVVAACLGGTGRAKEHVNAALRAATALGAQLGASAMDDAFWTAAARDDPGPALGQDVGPVTLKQPPESHENTWRRGSGGGGSGGNSGHGFDRGGRPGALGASHDICWLGTAGLSLTHGGGGAVGPPVRALCCDAARPSSLAVAAGKRAVAVVSIPRPSVAWTALDAACDGQLSHPPRPLWPSYGSGAAAAGARLPDLTTPTPPPTPASAVPSRSRPAGVLLGALGMAVMHHAPVTPPPAPPASASTAADGAGARALAAHPAGAWFVSGGAGGRFQLRSYGQGTPVSFFSETHGTGAADGALGVVHAADVESLTFHPSGERFASLNHGGGLAVWSLAAVASAPSGSGGAVVRPLVGVALGSRGAPGGGALSYVGPGGVLLAAATSSSEVVLWDSLQPPRSARVAALTAPGARCVAGGNHDGDDVAGFLVAVGGARGDVAVFDLRALGGGGGAGRGPLWHSRAGDAHVASVGRVSFTGGGRAWAAAGAEGGVLLSAGRGGQVHLWEAGTGRLLQVLPVGASAGEEGGYALPAAAPLTAGVQTPGSPVVALAPLPHGVLTCSEDGALRLSLFM